MGRPVKLAIFDFDGTLCATHEAITHCIDLSFRHHGRIAPDPGRVRELIGRGLGLADTFKALDALPRNDEGSMRAWIGVYRSYYNGGPGQSLTRLFPGARDVLATITSTGARIVVLSNKGEVAVRTALDRFDIASFVSLTVCDRPGRKMKPDPTSYYEEIRASFADISAAETIMVGDTVADIQFARNIQVCACWATYGYGDAAACRSLSPDIVIDALSDLYPIFDRLPTTAGFQHDNGLVA